MRPRKQPQPHVSLAPAPPTRPTPEQIRLRGRRIWRAFLTGLFFITLVLLLKVGLEHTEYGHVLHRWVYYRLMSSLQSADDKNIVIVDLTRFPKRPDRIDAHEENVHLAVNVTDRQKLLGLLEAIARTGPCAIGVDVDFSPEIIHNHWYALPSDIPKDASGSDKGFLQNCLDLRIRYPHTPIFLGVERTQAYPSDLWLGGLGYVDMAANISVFAEDPQEDPLVTRVVRKMPAWTIVANEDNKEDCLPSLSAALANAFLHCTDAKKPGQSEPRRRVPCARLEALVQRAEFLPQWFVDVVDMQAQKLEPAATPVTFGEELFLVDYSPLDSLMKSKLSWTDTEVIARTDPKSFRGKVVILGMATPTDPPDREDYFAVPGPNKWIRGIYLHACAASTLMRKAPLYELKPAVRVAIDVLLSLAILLMITAVCLYFNGKTSEEVNVRRLHITAALFLAVAVLSAAAPVALWTRIIWDDALAVGIGLVVHVAMEPSVERVWQRTREVGPALWRRFLFGGSQETRP